MPVTFISEAEITRRQQMAEALTKLAEDIGSGKLPVPYAIEISTYWTLDSEGHISEPNTVNTARRAMDATPGNWSKNHTANYTQYTKWYGNGVSFIIGMDRSNVCRKVQVGVKHVPAVAAHEEPVYEWSCGPDKTQD